MSHPVQEGAILVVEDEALLAMEIEAELDELGLSQVFLAADLACGRTYLRSRSFSLAVLDVNVGPELVFPLAAEVVATGIPILFSTARSADEFPSEWKHYPVLRKPWGRSALEHALARLGYKPGMSPTLSQHATAQAESIEIWPAASSLGRRFQFT